MAGKHDRAVPVRKAARWLARLAFAALLGARRRAGGNRRAAQPHGAGARRGRAGAVLRGRLVVPRPPRPGAVAGGGRAGRRAGRGDHAVRAGRPAVGDRAQRRPGRAGRGGRAEPPCAPPARPIGRRRASRRAPAPAVPDHEPAVRRRQGDPVRAGRQGRRPRRARSPCWTGRGSWTSAALAREAVDHGADLLGVAGGDGTQALVAGIAAGRDVPMVVISAGTRNHFALDLGLDRDDPAAGLDALGATASRSGSTSA